MPDVVVAGAGIVGAACAYQLARAGAEVVVVEATGPAAGTSSRGEGNILVSDKRPGPELDLALLSVAEWHATADQLGARSIELEHKGGLVVAASGQQLRLLVALADQQAGHGVAVEHVSGDRLQDVEPGLASGLAGAVRYQQDLQVQPALATVRLLEEARRLGADLRFGERVERHLPGPDGEVVGVQTDRERLPARVLVNATGVWSPGLAAACSTSLPVQPRRGVVLVTEPGPVAIRHKVYAAEYVADVASDTAGLQTSTVVEGTPGGTVLIGASRERVGLDETISADVVRQLAAKAVRLFPALRDAYLLRAYVGFRPYSPDHLPIIGWDDEVPGLLHATGHEGAGIGLAPGTARLVTDLVVAGPDGPGSSGTGPVPGQIPGRPGSIDVRPFSPARFTRPPAVLR